MQSSGLVVRPYREGDAERISEIYERCYSAYSGHARRTPGYWQWFNLHRPGVDPDAVLVAEREGRLVGSVTLTPAGELLDQCYDPDGDGYEILRRLLNAAEELAVKRGIEWLVLNVPRDDPVANRACQGSGMRQKELRRTFSINISNRGLLLSRLLAESRPPRGSYALDVRRGSESVERLRIEVSAEGCQVTNDEGEADVTIRIQEGTLTRLVFKGSGFADWAMRRISFSPAWKAPMALGLLRKLHLGSRWFVPRGGTF